MQVIDLRPRLARQRRRGLGPTLMVSLGLHLLVLLTILFVRVVERPPEASEAAPAIAMVFEGGKQTQPTGPNPSKAMEIPDGETSDQPQTAPAPPPTPPSPPPTPQTEVNILPPEYQEQQTPPPPPPAPSAEAMPQVTPQPATVPHPAPHRMQQNNPFAHPMQFSFAPPAPNRQARGLRGSHSLDLSMGPVIRDGRIQDAVAHVASPNASADWRDAVESWIETHKYYPRQAAENGEDGTSVIRATIARDGRVKSVQLVNSSGSQWLDLSTLSIFRDQKLPPFPDDMKDPDVTVTLDMDYELLHP